DLPGEVVEPGVFRLVGGLPRANLEQAEVVVVGRAWRAQERRPAGDLQPHLEAEGSGVEVDGPLETVHVEDGVVQAADGHRAVPRLSGSARAADAGAPGTGAAVTRPASTRHLLARQSRAR